MRLLGLQGAEVMGLPESRLGFAPSSFFSQERSMAHNLSTTVATSVPAHPSKVCRAHQKPTALNMQFGFESASSLLEMFGVL